MLRWVENPYWQHFCGMRFFEHTLPIDSSSMTRWRKLIGEKGAEQLLAESIAAGLKTQTIKPASLDKVNVDTTVQEKAVAFPTDARLYYRMREKLVRLAERCGIRLRQSYRRLARKSLIMVGRYGRAGQRKLLRRETRRLRSYLRKVIADLMRKIGENQGLQTMCWDTLLEAVRLLEQKDHPDWRKLYSVHAPEVEYIGKGILGIKVRGVCGPALGGGVLGQAAGLRWVGLGGLQVCHSSSLRFASVRGAADP